MVCWSVNGSVNTRSTIYCIVLVWSRLSKLNAGQLYIVLYWPRDNGHTVKILIIIIITPTVITPPLLSPGHTKWRIELGAVESPQVYSKWLESPTVFRYMWLVDHLVQTGSIIM